MFRKNFINLNYQEEKTMKRISLMLCLLLTVLTINFSVNAKTTNTIPLPKPTGEYGVGTITLPLVDTSRDGEKYANIDKKAEHRELMVQIWYPANRGITGETKSYLDDVTRDYILKSDLLKAFPECLAWINSLRTNSVNNAPIACDYNPNTKQPKRYPVLVFSPGWGNFYSLYQSLFEDLASHGYIIVGVNHPGISGVTAMPDGNYYTSTYAHQTDTETNDAVQVLETDLRFVAQQLHEIDRNKTLPVSGHLDLKHLGILGHSIGGTAAFQTCIGCPEYLAALNLDGGPYGNGYYQKLIQKPMTLVRTDIVYGADSENLFSTLWTNIKQGYRIEVAGAIHSSFGDYPILNMPESLKSILLNNMTINPEQVVRITKDCVRYFFDINLKNIHPNQMLTLRQKYPEVTLDVHNTR
jgi:predicted dienelactone hydrolase